MSEESNHWINPRDAKLTLDVPGGLLELMHRCQNGEATCMYVAKLVEGKADKAYEALEAAEKALTDAYASLEAPQIRDVAHTQVLIRVALAKVRSQLL